MKYIVKTVAGVLYILATYFLLVICTIIMFMWELNFKFMEELWKDHDVFYKRLLFKDDSLEVYRYNTIWDYVIDNKEYSHKSELFKPKEL
jgi:hypothetical protein